MFIEIDIEKNNREHSKMVNKPKKFKSFTDWREYERQKAEIARRNLSAREYEQEIKKLIHAGRW
jgi:hypothetical protein